MVLNHSMIEKETRTYTCGYCKNVFKQDIGSSVGSGESHKLGSSKKASSQVVCHKCGNFLKTYSGVVKKKWLK